MCTPERLRDNCSCPHLALNRVAGICRLVSSLTIPAVIWLAVATGYGWALAVAAVMLLGVLYMVWAWRRTEARGLAATRGAGTTRTGTGRFAFSSHSAVPPANRSARRRRRTGCRRMGPPARDGLDDRVELVWWHGAALMCAQIRGTANAAGQV